MEFIKNSYQAYANITFFDMLFSSPLLLMVKLFLYFICALLISITVGMRGLKGGGFLALFFILMAIAVFFGLRSYKKFETASPIRQKVFAYRIAQLVEHLGSRVQRVETTPPSVMVALTGAAHPLTIRYGKNLIINTGGTVGGVPLALPKRAHPKTFYMTLCGTCRLFEQGAANIDFSARTDDEDKVFGFGVREFRLEKRFLAGNEHVAVTASSPEVTRFMEQLRQAIDGTGLKGEIEFDHGRFQLTLFDPVERMTTVRGKITYRHYKAMENTGKLKIQESQQAFFGIERVIGLVNPS